MMRYYRLILWFSLLFLIFLHTFPTIAETVSPAFDNSVKTYSSVSNMRDVALESSLKSAFIRADGSGPGEVHYSFSISAVNKSAEGAVGIARTEFAISTWEGRDLDTNVSSTREWKDKTQVSGTIVNFRKNFDYASGLYI
jgi:hypothetical protein